MTALDPQPPQPQVVYIESRSNGIALASLIVGILGCIMAGGLAILFWAGWLLGATGLVLGSVGFAKAKKTGVRRKMAIWGIVLNLAAIAFGIYGVVVTVNAVNDVGKALDSYSQCIDNAQTLDQMDACD
jgi:hypothetical protein